MRRQPEFRPHTSRPRWPHALVALLAIVGTALATAFSAAPSSARAQTPDTDTDTSAPLDHALEHAQSATSSGDLRAADALLRRAWSDPATRDTATRELWQLHRRPDFALRADEAAVDRSLALLGKRFRRLDTPHFVILSDAPPQWVRTRSVVVERARAQFYRVMAKLDLPVVPHATRQIIVIFNNAYAYRAFAKAHDNVDAAWVAGYFAAAANRVVIYNQDSSPDAEAARDLLDGYAKSVRDLRTRARTARNDGDSASADRLEQQAATLDARVAASEASIDAQTAAISDTKLIHETIHLLAFNSGLQRPDRPAPFWLSEGLATSFEALNHAEPFGPDRPRSLIPDRLDRLANLLSSADAPITLDQLIARPDAGSADERTADAMYGLSHALFMHLIRRQPEQLADLFTALADRPAEDVTPQRFAEVFAEHFGEVNPLERSIRRAMADHASQRTADADQD